MDGYDFVYERQITLAKQSQCAFRPKVSIVLPVYQVEKYLRECLDSILAQTFQEFELLCVNDGSKDRSLEILMEYAALDKRITVLCQENAGLPAARNTALLRAAGDYICFVDSDDRLEPHALSVLYEKATQTGADIVYFNAVIQADAPSFFEKTKYKPDRYIRQYPYPPCARGIEMLRMMKEQREFRHAVWLQFFRRAFLAENHLAFFENIRYFEDGILTERCAVKANTIAFIPDCLYIYRLRSESIVTMDAAFLHAYGHFLTGTALAGYYVREGLLEEYPWLMASAHTSITKAKKIYKKLSADEKEKISALPEEEQALFRLIIEHPYLEPRLTRIKKAHDTAARQLTQETDKRIMLEQRNQELERQLQLLKAQYERPEP